MENNSPLSTLNSPLKNHFVILLIEDDERLSYINSHALESEGYEVVSAFTLAQARLEIDGKSPDVILLDVKLPDGSGFDFCREIRERTAAHIIFLTSVTESEGEMEGLVAGGNDYLRKPYSIELLRERVKNALRLLKVPQNITRGSLTLDITAGRAYTHGKDLLLSPKEFQMLQLFVQNEGKAFDGEYLYEKIWKQPLNVNMNALKSAVSGLRKKLAGSGYTIVAERGAGYCFEKE